MHLLIDLQACQSPDNRNRGIGRYSLSLAKAMAHAVKHSGPDATGISRVSLLLSDRFPETIEPLRELFTGFVAVEDIYIMAVPANLHYLSEDNTINRAAAKKIRCHTIKNINPDVVHVSSLFEGFSDDTLVSVEPGVPPTGITLYDLIPLLHSETYLPNATFENWYYRQLMYLRQSNVLLAISEASRQECIAELNVDPRQVVNISAAIEPHFKPLEISESDATALFRRYAIKKSYLLYTGGINARKNIEGLIRAFASLPHDLRANYQLVIVCATRSADVERLRSEVIRCDLPLEDVVFTGYVPENQLVMLYNLARLFVFPSLHEGFGLPVLEAMACGTPVIGSNCSSIPEVVGRKDALFDPHSPASISDAIAYALSTPSYLKALSEHGLEQASRFSWDASARLALQALSNIATQAKMKPEAKAVIGRRPRLAFFSPLPPERSGIADYSAALVPYLAKYYDIELIVELPVSRNGERSKILLPLENPWLRANFPIRTVEWFEAHADRFDRVLYHIGNSHFHSHMFSLMRCFPGVIVLHDFFLSGVLNYMQALDPEPQEFSHCIFYSHGFIGVRELIDQNRDAVVYKYPANRQVLDSALSVIVHSEYSREQACSWYGDGYREHFNVVPFPATVSSAAKLRPSRIDARRQLGISENCFLVCSFGFLAATKLNIELIKAWHACSMPSKENTKLVFVGELPNGAYAEEVKSSINPLGRCVIDPWEREAPIHITRFVDSEDYALWLAAADVGVQLRTHSRGETSAAIFDCMSHGLPLIFNAHGTAAELPPHIGIRLLDDFSIDQLANAIQKVYCDSALRVELSKQSAEYLQERHNPTNTAKAYAAAIENAYTLSPMAHEKHLIEALADVVEGDQVPASLTVELARCIVQNRRTGHAPCMLVDITGVDDEWLRPWLLELILRMPVPWKIEVVEQGQSGWVTARHRVCALMGIFCPLREEAIVVRHCDHWVVCNVQVDFPNTIDQSRSYEENALVESRSIDIDFDVSFKPGTAVELESSAESHPALYANRRARLECRLASSNTVSKILTWLELSSAVHSHCGY